MYLYFIHRFQQAKILVWAIWATLPHFAIHEEVHLYLCWPQRYAGPRRFVTSTDTDTTFGRTNYLLCTLSCDSMYHLAVSAQSCYHLELVR